MERVVPNALESPSTTKRGRSQRRVKDNAPHLEGPESLCPLRSLCENGSEDRAFRSSIWFHAEDAEDTEVGPDPRAARPYLWNVEIREFGKRPWSASWLPRFRIKPARGSISPFPDFHIPHSTSRFGGDAVDVQTWKRGRGEQRVRDNAFHHSERLGFRSVLAGGTNSCCA